MAESKEELKTLLMKVKEKSEKSLQLNIQKTKIMASSPITSWQIDGKWWKQWLTLFLRSEEHTSELQSQSVIAYAVFCL